MPDPVARMRPAISTGRALALCVCLVMFSTAPAQSPPETESAGTEPANVAIVNGMPIRHADFEVALEEFKPRNGLTGSIDEAQREQVRKIVLDGLIGSLLLYQKARSIPIEIPQEEIDTAVARAREGMGQEAFESKLHRRGLTENGMKEQVRRNLTVQRLIQDLVGSVRIGEEEIKAFYDSHITEMIRPASVEASHILVKLDPQAPPEKREEARHRIEEAHERLEAGEDFGDVARVYSEDRSAQAGGGIGRVLQGQALDVIDKALFSLAVGETSGILESRIGFHIVKVTGRTESGTVGLEEARASIRSSLEQSKAAEALEEMVASLRAEARIEIP